MVILNMTGEPVPEEIKSAYSFIDVHDEEVNETRKDLMNFDETPTYNELVSRAECFVDTVLSLKETHDFSKVLLPDRPAWFVSHIVEALLIEDLTPCFIGDFAGVKSLVEVD